MPHDFSRIDNPQENLVLDTESKSRISEAIAVAHIDRIESLDEEKRQSFMPKFAKKLRVEVPTSPQDYLKYSERENYEHGKFKYSDLESFCHL